MPVYARLLCWISYFVYSSILLISSRSTGISIDHYKISVEAMELSKTV